MFRRKRDSRDFIGKVEEHLNPDADQFAQGLTHKIMRAAARCAFANHTITGEQFYGRGRSLLWDHLWREMRSAVRALSRERAFAAFAVFLIGLGAGLLTTMFALVDAVTLRKLNVPDPDSLINIVALREGRETELPYILFEPLQQNLDIADSLCATSNSFIPITYDGRTVMVSTQFVIGDYYQTMRARPLLGRTLTPDDNEPVAVISDTFWRRIGQDTAVIGKMIQTGSVPLTIVGVVPASAHEFWRFVKTDMIVPFRIGMLFESQPPETLFRHKVDVTARLKKGLSPPQVQHRLDALWPRRWYW